VLIAHGYHNFNDFSLHGRPETICDRGGKVNLRYIYRERATTCNPPPSTTSTPTPPAPATDAFSDEGQGRLPLLQMGRVAQCPLPPCTCLPPAPPPLTPPPLLRSQMEKEKDGFPVTSLREINILLNFHHPNVINVSEVVMSKRWVWWAQPG
jgi:hypothetical protein